MRGTCDVHIFVRAQQDKHKSFSAKWGEYENLEVMPYHWVANKEKEKQSTVSDSSVRLKRDVPSPD